MSMRPLAILIILLFGGSAGLVAASLLGVDLPWSIASKQTNSATADKAASGDGNTPSEASTDAATAAKEIQEKAVAALEDIRDALLPKDPVTSASKTESDAAPDQTATDAGTPSSDEKTKLDIARISPTDSSVLAGRTEPNSYLTILADGTPIGTVKSDSFGDFSLVTEYKFTNLDPKWSFKISDEAPKVEEPKQVAALDTETTGAGADPSSSVAADANATKPNSPAQKVLRAFERLVEEAREESKQKEATPANAEADTKTEASTTETEASSSAASEPETAPAETKVAAGDTTPSSGTSAKSEDTTAKTATDEVATDTEQDSSSSTAAASSSTRDARSDSAVSVTQTPESPAVDTTSEPTEIARADVTDPAPETTPSSGTQAQASDQEDTATSPTSSPAAPKKDQPTQVAKAKTQSADRTASDLVAIPVPIMFVYDEATLTSEGKRAANLLLEYVTLKKLTSVSLTGHADERGTHEYNMDLSRERLETVQTLLKNGGYDGKLELMPKGKTEPYHGVDRSKFSRDDLYQLDRRVELRFVR